MKARTTPFWLKFLTPKTQLESAFEITPAWLQTRGLKGLALDIDNTLAPTHLAGNESQIRTWLEPLKQANIPIRIISNGHPQRILEFCELFKLEYVDILNSKMAGKPIPMAYSRAYKEMDLKPFEVAMVGDQIFTDVLGSNLAGMYSVLVKPLSEKTMSHTKLIRKLEKLVLARLERERI
jgi:HAD superfamily phosphatase (TIGR01668 family)